jgi:hypothetical protein
MARENATPAPLVIAKQTTLAWIWRRRIVDMANHLISRRSRGAVLAVFCAALATGAVAGPATGAGLALSLGDPAYRDCVFDRAGVAGKVRGLDHLDRDMMFLRAARETPEGFLAGHTQTNPPHPFSQLFSRSEAAKLQRLVKARGVCRSRSGQSLQPWPLENSGAGR